MKAIVLNGNDVIKVTNLKRKRSKIEANPLMTILEEFENEIPEDRFNYWKSQYQKQDVDEEKVKRKEIWYRCLDFPECFYFAYEGEEPKPKEYKWRLSSLEEFKQYTSQGQVVVPV